MLRIKSVVIALSLMGAAGMASAASKTFTVDILETENNAFTQSDNGVPLIPGLLNGGTKILIEGKLYPAGTLAAECPDASQPCTPTTPSIGNWYCHATIMNTFGPNRPFVLGDQMYEFTDSPGQGIKLSNQSGTGANTIISNGYENGLGDPNPANRAVVGGTGAFSTATGQMSVTNLNIYPGNTPIGAPSLKAVITYSTTQQ